jgi:hypothetical protein
MNEMSFRIETAKKFKSKFKEYYPKNSAGISEISKEEMKIKEL